MPAARLHIGTSGWHYKDWVGDFYPAKFKSSEMLSWYSQRFKTVEINNSFYRLPEERDFKNWKDSVPDHFYFSVKASRFITHRKRLHDAESATQKFLSRAQLLGEKLGPILFQLPPNWRVNSQRLEEFLVTLPAKNQYVFEFRDPSWYVPKIYALLKHHKAALCLHDWHGSQWPVEFTSNFTYVRFHGSQGSYAGGYSMKHLQRWAENVLSWQERLAEVFLYFNNDRQGHAVRDAQSLSDLLGQNTQLQVA